MIDQVTNYTTITSNKTLLIKNHQDQQIQINLKVL